MRRKNEVSPEVIVSGLEKFGGGSIVHWRHSRISLHLEGDFIRSQLYSQGQNNFTFGTGFIIH